MNNFTFQLLIHDRSSIVITGSGSKKVIKTYFWSKCAHLKSKGDNFDVQIFV